MQLLDVSRGEAVGDVDQDERRAAERRELTDVVDDRRVEPRMLEGNEDSLIHQLIQARNVCTSSQTLSDAMMNATSHASTFTQAALTN